MSKAETCVCCGQVIPEGRQVCVICGYKVENGKPDLVEVKHGKWISLEEEIGLYSCSICEHKIIKAKSNYCPNCGAKMDWSDTE